MHTFLGLVKLHQKLNCHNRCPREASQTYKLHWFYILLLAQMSPPKEGGFIAFSPPAFFCLKNHSLPIVPFLSSGRRGMWTDDMLSP